MWTNQILCFFITLGIFAFPSQNKKIRERVITHFEENMNTLIPYLLGFDYAENSETILEAVKKRYFNEKPFKESFHGFSKVCQYQNNLKYSKKKQIVLNAYCQ